MLAVLALISAAAGVPDAFQLPDVPHVEQKPDYCGEACVEMALRHFELPGTQDDVWSWAPIPRGETRGAWTRELKVAVERAGFEPGQVWYETPARDPARGMTEVLDAALADLRAGYPSILCMHYSSAADAPEHFRLLVGYERGGDTLLFEDPAADRGPTRFTRAELFELWPLKYDPSRYTLIRLALKPADPYARHIAAARAKYGGAISDLTPAVSAPFVVWGEGPHPDTRTVQWARTHLESDFFKRRPDAIYDVFLFDGADSYESHAKAMFDEAPSTPYGYASAQHHALVMNIATGGGTLVHELVHPYVAANFTDAPTWLNEGLASLYEQSSERDGHIIGLPNWRLPALQRALTRGEVMPLARLVRTTDAMFRDADEGLHYAQARYLMQYLQEQRLLRPFIARALELQAPERALRETLGEKRWANLDAAWRKWVLGLTFE